MKFIKFFIQQLLIILIVISFNVSFCSDKPDEKVPSIGNLDSPRQLENNARLIKIREKGDSKKETQMIVPDRKEPPAVSMAAINPDEETDIQKAIDESLT